MFLFAKRKLSIHLLAIFILLSIFSYLTGCKKDSVVSTHETGTMMDIDSNIYQTVKIGKQWWMAENLKVTKYRNGEPIMDIGSKLDSALWNKSITGTYFKGSLGILYNYYVISDSRNIAPEGWHVPTDDEWKALEIEIGMSQTESDQVNWRGSNEGNKLKLQGAGATVWTNPTNKYEVWGTNESGFSAIPVGCVLFNGILGNPGVNYTAFWWSATLEGSNAWYRYLDYNKPNVFRFYGPRTYGFSIRCIKDVVTK